MIVLDTGPVFEALDTDARRHQEARAFLGQEPEPLLLSPFVLAELDYMVANRLGQPVEERFLTDVATGAYELVSLDTADIDACLTVIKRYRALNIGLADASVAVIAAKFRTARLFTRDHQHFRAIKPLWGEYFTLLPADGPG